MSNDDTKITQARLDAEFAALADPTRRAILSRLLAGDATVGALAEPFNMSLAAVSKHLTILTNAGLITQRREGREKFCRLEVDALAPAARWMRGFGHDESADWDRLEEVLEALGQGST